MLRKLEKDILFLAPYLKRIFCRLIIGKGIKGNMTSYYGYAFFVDILGFSELTQGRIELTDEDYVARRMPEEQRSNEYFAANLLIAFREVLTDVSLKVRNVKIAQLSDCAFIWSKDVWSLLRAIHLTMWQLIQDKGILCRGGIGFGNIIEAPKVPTTFGEFVVGSAITMAVKNESRFKGLRIAMDENFPKECWNNIKDHSKSGYKIIRNHSNDLFHPCESPIDLQIVDEYRWYICNDDFFNSAHPSETLAYDEKVALTKERLCLANALSYDPRMRWNNSNVEGKLHMRSGIKSITANRLLGILHNFSRDIIPDIKRTTGQLSRMNKKVMDDKYYSIEQEAEWQVNLTDLD